MKKYWKEILLVIIVSLVLIPLAIAWTLSFRLINTDTTNEWIGFWGGYLGSILGGAITLYVMWKTLQIEKSNREREERINYFNNIIHLWAELSESINEIKTYIDRCICESGNNNIEKVCIGEGHTIKVLVELKVTLTTRKNIYELQELLEILECDFEFALCLLGDFLHYKTSEVEISEKMVDDYFIQSTDEEFKKKLKIKENLN